MLRSLEVVEPNDIAQALNQTIQVRPFGSLLSIQLYSGMYVRTAYGVPVVSERRSLEWIGAMANGARKDVLALTDVFFSMAKHGRGN